MSRTNLDSTKDYKLPIRSFSTNLQYDPSNYPNKIWITSTSYSEGVGSRLVERRSGAVTPKFGWKLDNGQNIGQNNFSYTKSRTVYPYRYYSEHSNSTHTFRAGPEYYDYMADTSFDAVLTSLQKSNQRNQAIIALRGELKQMSVNVAQAYAERARTIDLVGDSLLKLVSAASDLRKGNIAGAMSKLPGRVSRGAKGSVVQRTSQEGAGAAFGRNWLELQYGWRPLVTDVYGACEALARAKTKMPLLKAVGRSSRDYDVSRTASDSAFDTRVYTTKIRRDQKFTAYVKINDGGAHTLSSLGLTNPATIAWELMPWSFVVDWALPIGPWIEGMDAMIGLDFVSCSETVFVKGKSSLAQSYYKDSRSGNPNGSVVSDFRLSSFESVSVSRSVLSDIPTAYFPYVKNPLSGQHVANALALLLANFAGKR